MPRQPYVEENNTSYPIIFCVELSVSRQGSHHAVDGGSFLCSPNSIPIMEASVHEPVACPSKALKVNHFSFLSCDLVFICYLQQVACLLGVARGNS